MRTTSRYSLPGCFAILHLLFTLCLSQNLTFANETASQQQQWCSGTAGMCFAINVPSSAASEYYMAITAPSNIGWASIGIGSKMSNSLMFIIANDNGNVTLSVRTTTGHDTPRAVSNVTATLQPGTGSNGSYMTAKIHVLDGMSWHAGSLDVGSNQQSFIWGFSPNSPSGGASGNIKQHVVVGSFTLDMTSAIGSGGMPTIVTPETSWGWQSTVLAHAVIMGLVWVGAFPAGAIIIRFIGDKVHNPVLIHQILQLTSFFFMFIAFFIGVGASVGQQFQFGHQWIGLFIFLGLIVQAPLGWYHHRRYQQDKPISRRWFTHLHLWLGRFLLFLALINIGLGIQLYGDGAGAQAVWYLFVIAVVAAYAFFYWRKHYRNKKRINDSFDPSPFEEGPADEPLRTYETYRPVNVAAMGDNDLGTYKSEYYDTDETNVNEFGGRPTTGQRVPRPNTAAQTGSGRRYDINSTPVVQGPYAPTEPLRPSGNTQYVPPPPPPPPQQQDPFADPRPRTGARSDIPYPVSMVNYDEQMPSAAAPPYDPRQYGVREI